MVVKIEKKGPVTTIILARPEARNAVDRPTAEALVRAFEAFEQDEEALVAVLFGENGQFCAGADLKALGSGDPARVNVLSKEEGAQGPMGPTRMFLSKPVIAAISGYAVAGGLELALWCDMRVAEEDSILGVFCRRFGVPLIDGGTVRLPRLIGTLSSCFLLFSLLLSSSFFLLSSFLLILRYSTGLSRALDLILTGRPVTASEALQMGLVNRVVPKGKARESAEALALSLAAFPQTCLRGDRASAYEQFHCNSWKEALANEFEHGMASVMKEGRKGAESFMKGRGRHGDFNGGDGEGKVKAAL
ncbi:enoyl-CoA hydratase isomerase [Balamuthia mandrillaris]